VYEAHLLGKLSEDLGDELRPIVADEKLQFGGQRARRAATTISAVTCTPAVKRGSPRQRRVPLSTTTRMAHQATTSGVASVS